MANVPMMAATISKPRIWFLFSIATLASAAVAETGLYQSRQLTPSGEYTFNIEGPAVDRAGNLYVVNFQRPGTIGKVATDGTASELFATLPDGSAGNAIRFDKSGRMFIADYRKHNVFVVEPGTAEPRLYFHSDDFNQPNDLTVAADGTLYASDPSWKGRTGQVWRITRGADGNGVGEKMTSPRPMSTTNGIDLSPDGKTLYVGESNSIEIWAYQLEGTALTSPRLVRKFSDADIDGLRTDIDGRIYVARLLKGVILILKPDGTVEREVPLTAKEPTNLAFGGEDGRTLFVTQRKGGFIETFRVAWPGREFCLQAGCLK